MRDDWQNPAFARNWDAGAEIGDPARALQLTTAKARDDAQRFYRRLGFTASHEGMKLRLT
jgi:hypothetical protein